MGYIFESYVCIFQRPQLFVKFDIYVWLEWPLPCPEDDSFRGSAHYENNWLLGSIVLSMLVKAWYIDHDTHYNQKPLGPVAPRVFGLGI